MLTTPLLALLAAAAPVPALVALPPGPSTLELPGVACDAELPPGWQATGSDRHRLKVPAALAAGTELALRVAPSAEACPDAVPLVLVVTSAPPSVETASLTFFPESGRLELKGKGLEGAAVRWTAADKSGSDTCAAGTDGCAVSLPKDLASDALRVAVLAPGTPPAAQVAVSTTGALVPLEPSLKPVRFVLPAVLTADVLSLERDPPALKLKHPEAVEAVACVDADCSLEDDAVVVRREHGADADLELKLKLRPHWFVQGAALDANPPFRIPIQRCPLQVASPPPIQGIADQRLVVRVGGLCAKDEALGFETPAGRVSPLRAVTVGAERYVVLPLSSVGAADLTIRVVRSDRVWGQTSTPTRLIPSLHTTLRLDGVGAVDFVPNNRDVDVEPIRLRDAVLEPLSVEDVFHVSGGRKVRANGAVSGHAPLHFAYKSPSLPGELASLTLAELTEPLDRELHAADTPVDLSTTRAVWLQCGDGEGHVLEPARDVTTTTSFRARTTCRLRFDRAVVPPEAGRQILAVRVRVFSADGSPRPDASRDQRVVLSADHGPSELLIEGITDAFDRLVVTVAHVVDAHRLVDDSNTVDGLRWTVVFGTQRARLYASATFPSGLFRIAEPEHSGVLTLNAGGLLRLVWLSKDGQESPLGLESGMLWTSIAGDLESQVAPHGQMALVAGIGIGIPIADAGRGAQTSINLHCWGELEVSRAIAHQPGTPWAVIIGPSLTVGDLGASF